MQRRKVIRGVGSLVVWVTDRGRIPAEVVEDAGVGLITIRIEATGDSVDVEHDEIETRRTAIRPPPGGGGRDVPPLDFSGPDKVSACRVEKAGEPRPVHGVPARLVPQPKTVTYRDGAHLDLVRTLPCAVPWCRKSGPSQACHARGPRGIGEKVSDARTFPGCFEHHRAIDTADLRASDGRRYTADESYVLQLEMVVETQEIRIKRLSEEKRATRGRRTA